MKTLAKPIGLVVLLVTLSFNLMAQELLFSNLKLIRATYWYGEDVNTEYEEGDTLIIKGINGESLLASTLSIRWVIKEDEIYFILRMQTVESYNAGKLDWYEEIIKEEDYVEGKHEDYGENTIQIEARRKNGGIFVIEYKGNSELKRIYIIDEEKGTEIALNYLEME